MYGQVEVTLCTHVCDGVSQKVIFNLAIYTIILCCVFMNSNEQGGARALHATLFNFLDEKVFFLSDIGLFVRLF